MKRWLCLALAAVLCVSAMAASAEAKSKLGDFSGRLKKGAAVVQTPAAEPEDKPAEAPAAAPAEVPAAAEGKNVGPEVRIDSAEFAKVRSSAYLNETSYTKEANVMIELKNISGKTLYPDDVSVIAYNAAGEVIEEETYSDCGPKKVENGGSLFVWEWFYGFDAPIEEISCFEVKITSETEAWNDYMPIAGEVFVENGAAYVMVKNTTDSPVFDVEATVVMEGEEGQLLDVTSVGSYQCGVTPGSEMIMRSTASDYANDGLLMGANAAAYVQYKLSRY